MIGTFKANNPYNNFLLLLYGLVLKLPMFIHPRVPKAQQLDGFLYRALLKWLAPNCDPIPVVYSFLAFFLLYIQAISVNKLLNSHRLLPKPNYLAGMSYLLITSLFSEWYGLSAPLIVNTFLIWVLSRLCTLYNNPNAKTILFNIGMVTGLGTLFYFPSIGFSLLIIVGVIITRPFKLPEWIIALLGILTPYYFFGSWFYLTGRWESYTFPGFSINGPVFHENISAYTVLILVSIIIFTGILFIQNNMRRLLVQSRKSWSLIYLYLLVAMLVPFLNATHNFDYWILTAVPIATFSAAAFLFPERKWFAIFFHWSLVLLAIIVGYFIK
ncbi:MAG: DUF6427 family protein [Ferruginibacter sp.]